MIKDITKKLSVLVACEESQAVTSRLRKKGINAFSCDLLEFSGGLPQYHIVEDVTNIINGNTIFKTSNNDLYVIHKCWDYIIAFPPCTHLAVSGARHFEKKREDGRQRNAIELFAQIYNAQCEHIAIENPVNIIGSEYIKKWFPEFSYLPNPTQYIQPYEFGDKYRKKTGLWLKGLNKLTPTNIVEPEIKTIIRKDGRKTTYSVDCGIYKSGVLRSKTYPGIADAIVSQWFN